MSNTPCHSRGLDHVFTSHDPDCAACGWAPCAMESLGCDALVPGIGLRCETCHPLGCPCEECEDSDGVPQPVDADEDFTAAGVTARLVVDRTISQSGNDWCGELSRDQRTVDERKAA